MKIRKDLISKNKSSRLYNIEIPIVGLTGGIATGKSTASSILEKEGCSVICADKLVKSVYADQKTKDYISEKYPSAVKNKDIDFKKLRELFFSNKEIQIDIEQHIYSQLPTKFNEKLNSFGHPSFVIYDVPLLFEKGLDAKVDFTVVIYADKKTQVERLTNRDNITNELAEKILEKQISIDDKKEKSNFVINNMKDTDTLKSELHNLLNLITSKE